MIPGRLVTVDRLPTTPNGKIDRAALRRDARAEAPAPVAATLVQRVRAAWQEVLGVEVLADDVNFFDAGGYSLLVMDLQAALRFHAGTEVSVVDLFAHPTIGGLAGYLATRRAAEIPAAPSDSWIEARGSRLRALAGRRRDQEGS
jgi:polyketide synthase PksJ